MKLSAVLFVSTFAITSFTAVGQSGDPKPIQVFTSEAAAQAAAVKRFPELGKAGSTFNKTFLERAAEDLKDNPNWPIRIAMEVAADLTTNPKDALGVDPEPDPDRGKGASRNAIKVYLRNYGTIRNIEARIKITFDDKTTAIEAVKLEPNEQEAYSYYLRKKSIISVEVIEAAFEPDNLPAALAVRQEISAATPQASSGTTSAPPHTPTAIIQMTDPIQPRSVWIGDGQFSNHILTITERQGETFRARFLVGPKIIREVKGTIKDNKLAWYAKDVRAVQGPPGGDNFGTVNGDKIDFVWRAENGANGTFTLKQKNSQ